ncbi:MAG: hypothetical protein OEY33_07610 [Bdellovibrionales bacterium]|nr:hypothetical protein [Bdellovibrionales bacterium]
MMDFSSGFETHKDKIISCLMELKSGLMTDEQLKENLKVVHQKILPPMAKVFVKQNAFVEACMERKQELLKIVNKQERLSRFKIIN